MQDEERQTEKPAKKQTRKEPQTVTMTNGERQADVHPDMADEYRKGGFQEVGK